MLPSLEAPRRLEGRRIALTGRFVTMPQHEVELLVRELGGEVIAAPTRDTHLLVLGQEAWALRSDGRPTRKLVQARDLKAAGCPIEVVQEDEFFDELAAQEARASVRRWYTPAQLQRILGVSGQRIRAWVRLRLIVPVQVVHRLPYFDFRQVASAKRLCELLDGGVPVARLHASLEQMRRWLPGWDEPLAQLAKLEHRGQLLVRLDNGSLAEPHGQLRFDFDPAEDSHPLPMNEPGSETLFEQGLDHELQGRLPEAVRAYEAALQLAPHDPVLHFNLANVYYALESPAAAAEHFAHATEFDPSYIEAWNNFGSVLAELGRTSEALWAMRRALHLAPHYADAHYNLAQTLFEQGELTQACVHWQAYLRHDADSPWAQEVRQRLAEVDSCTGGAD